MTLAVPTSPSWSDRIDRDTVAPFAGLVIVLLLALVIAPDFYQSSNLATAGRQVAILSVIAVGQTVVMVAGGIDLSVGAVMTFAMVVVARFSDGADDRLLYTLGLCVALGVVVGAMNAFLVVVRDVPPFVATLATLILLRGAQTAWTRGVPSGTLPPALRSVGQSRLLGVPGPLLVAIVVALVLAWVMSSTTYGRWVYSAGSNPSAARLAGVPVGWVLSIAFVICSLCAVIGGLLLAGYVGYVDQYLGQGYDLDSIAAAVVGGAALTGGRGGIGRTIVGAATIAFLLNLIVLSGADNWLQLVVKGVIILVAVAVQQAARVRR
jgi:ribose transport system permease protein